MYKCEICGEPLPVGEEMFKFHGYSGPCPKLPQRAEWWKTRQWRGMKPMLHRAPRALAAQPYKPCPEFSWVSDPITGEPWCVPAENQNGPSCAGHGMANFKEVMLRRYVGRDTLKSMQQISGDAIWKRAREIFYAGDMDGGLYIPEAFQAALAMGVFAPGSVLKTVPRSQALQSPQFELTPFVDGHDVSGWVNHGTNQENGQVYEGQYPDGTGGHCTLHVSRLVQHDTNFWQDLNSWGTAFGWHGLFLMTEAQDEITALEDRMYYIEEPQGWQDWQGWKRCIV